MAETLSLKRPDLKVLLMSGYADQEVAGEGIDSLNLPFLGKPFRVSELLHKVWQVLGAA